MTERLGRCSTRSYSWPSHIAAWWAGVCMKRDLDAERELYEERLAICLADGVPYAEAHLIAEQELWAYLRSLEVPQKSPRSA
jgi:hypothetical protein